MSSIITQHCTSLEQSDRNNETIQNTNEILNDFHRELSCLQSSDPTAFRQEISKVTELLSKNILNLDESILQYLFDYFIQLLKEFYELTYFNDSNDTKTFENLSIIFRTYSYYCMNQSFVDEIGTCLLAIARNGKNMFTSVNIKVITRMLNVYTNIENNNGYVFMEVTSLDESIIKCLCASYTIEVFSQFNLSVKSEQYTDEENFVMNALFFHVSWMNRGGLQECADLLREHLLPSISNLLDTYLISSDDWSYPSVGILTTLTTSFLYSVQMTIVSDIHIDIQMHICDTALNILLNTNTRSMKLKNNCLQYVYMGTSNDKVLDYLKSQKLTETMFKIGNMYKDEAEIQFNVYRVLAAIMTEEDIKRLDDPGAIAKVFIDHLNQIKNTPGWETRIKNLLTSLKILLQHDQLRDEIYKQNGVQLFIYCATSKGYDTIIHQRALENLLIMAFHDKVNQELNENTYFVEQIKSMSENSEDADVQRAAQSLLWMLTKDETAKDSEHDESSEHAYDIMISYSHKDKDLCFQLYDRLQKDKFRVWLDRDQMHGTPLEAMSNAIEKSEFVFVCMSDSYKQSGYCKMEAHYALECQCTIIPLLMKAQYRPDGWLGIVVTGRMRIDFPKYGFDDAYDKLMVEISRNRKEKHKEISMQHHDLPAVSQSTHDVPSISKISYDIPIKEKKRNERVTYQEKNHHYLPVNIEQWTIDDVQQFFIKKKLECFLPICEKMNGTRLLRLYQMCTMNSPVMFQSLNNQLTITDSESKNSIIEIIEYLQFLEDVKLYVPIKMEKRDMMVPQSSACVIL